MPSKTRKARRRTLKKRKTRGGEKREFKIPDKYKRYPNSAVDWEDRVRSAKR